MQNSPARTDQPVRLLCAWNINGQFCEFPGVHSDDLFGKGPWYCSGHRRCHDAALGLQILTQSLRGPPITAESIRIAVTERAGREAAQFCADRGLATVAEKRALIGERRAMIDERIRSGIINRTPGEDDERAEEASAW